MRPLLTLTFALFLCSAQAQQTGASQTALFAQCMFSIQDEQEMLDLQEHLKQNPYTNVVRLDWHTQRAFILTMGLNSLTEEEFRSWFGNEGADLTCIQIGIHGVDTVDPYPFTNCQN